MSPVSSPSPAPSLPGPFASPTPVRTQSAPGVAVEPELLAILPESVDGLAVTPDPETAAESARDESLARSAEALATALVVDPASGEFAIANVVRLRPGTFSDGWFRDWRDTFDEGACSQAGGVTGHAEAAIAGRTTFIGTCAGGLHTYHVWLPERGVLVALSAFGERRLGELLIAGLRP